MERDCHYQAKKKDVGLLLTFYTTILPPFRFAYTVATVVLSTVVRQLKLHQVKGQVVEARSELVSTPKDDTWITVSRRS